MRHPRLLTFVVSAALGAGLLPVAQALAGTSRQAEAGCYDITADTQGAFPGVIKSAEQTGSGTVLDPYGELTYTYYENSGVLTVNVVLAASSCPAATYAVEVYRPGSDVTSRPAPAPLRTLSTSGDGSTGTQAAPLVLYGLFDHQPADAEGNVCVDARVTVKDTRGETVDVAPDVSEQFPSGLVPLCNKTGGGQGFGG